MIDVAQLLWLEMALFSYKASYKIEKHSKLSQWYFDKIKSFWKLMIWFCYFCKKKFFLLGVADGTPFSQKLHQKIVIFRSFTNFFSRTTGFWLKLLILIESQHISLETSKKKSRWVWSWGKIWAKLGPVLWKK